ncbi:MAG: hypothetical protein ACP5N1_06530 [Candidatus Woesearchaeota archaeon]
MIKEKKTIILLMLIATIILITPSVIRMFNHNSYSVNSESYYNMRLYNQGSTNYDTLQGEYDSINIINLLRLNDFARQILFKIVPMILGILTVLFIYLTLEKQNISERTIHAIIVLIITSPIFIYVFTDYKIYSFVIFLNILGIYFLAQNKILLSSAILAIIPFIDIFSGIIALILLLTYLLNGPKNKRSINISCISLFVAIILSIIINIYYGYNLINIFKFNIHNVITDIGANVGISFSIIILTIIGMILLWENGWRNLATYSLLLLFSVSMLFNDTIRIYLNFILMIYAGFAFIYLNKRKWSIAIIKKTTILLIVCSIFFSTLVYTTQLVRSEPSPEYVNALLFLKNQSLTTEVMLSSPNEGYMIEYYTERSVFIDESTQYSDSKKYLDLDILVSSRNLERTEKLLNEYSIKYVVVSGEFESYLIEKEGLLFLIQTSNKFVSIYKNTNIEIWMYVK